MNFFSILKLIFSMLPMIHQAIDDIEVMFPQGGYGAQKLDLLKHIIETAMKVSNIGEGVFGSVWPLISGMVGNIVSLKNTVKSAPGVTTVATTFKPSTDSAAPMTSNVAPAAAFDSPTYTNA